MGGVLGVVTTFASAQTAIIAGATISYPFDTVRRACRCRLRSQLKSIFIRELSIASRRLPPRKALQQVCTRVSLQTLSEVLALLSCLSCMIERRRSWVFNRDLSRLQAFCSLGLCCSTRDYLSLLRIAIVSMSCC